MLSIGHPGLACEPVVPVIFLRKERWEIACAVEDANHLDAVLYWTIKDVRVNRAGQEVAALTPKLSDAGSQAHPNWQLAPPARTRSSDLVSQ
jgi:hypothetical protein